ncbi:MAG: ABC transporter ATP-binding protein [Gammaproteobacteria bacterium]
MAAPVLDVQDLSVHFRMDDGLLKAVDGVSYEIGAGETLGLVGESGSGKTVSSLAVIGLLESPPASIASGSILLEGEDLLRLDEARMNDYRGRHVSMVFQEPMTSLNPVMAVGRQVTEVLTRHFDLSRRDARDRALELFKLVGIPSPATRLDEFAHQLSGGMRQRVMIALALACDPKVLIADEPTTALDVTIQAQILELLRSLQERLGTTILLITHDLAVVAETAHRVAVMYAGRVVEKAPVATLFDDPRHPYSQGLLRSIPRIDRVREPKLSEISGTVPDLRSLHAGCAFADRCQGVTERCWQQRPRLEPVEAGHLVSCWRAQDA